MSDRVKRPKVERTDPIRNWSALFGGARTGADTGVLNDVVARSVELGYRVVDEYVRQGQKAAARLTGGTADPEAVTGDMQELSARMAQYASDMAGMWFQMVDVMLASPAAGASPTAGPTSAPRQAPQPAAPPAVEPVRVRVEIVSLQPVEVGIDLRPGAGNRPLIVHALRAVDAEKPPLTAAIVPGGEDGVVQLRVHVPDAQPPGTYSGLLIDAASSLPVGTLTLRVGPT